MRGVAYISGVGVGVIVETNLRINAMKSELWVQDQEKRIWTYPGDLGMIRVNLNSHVVFKFTCHRKTLVLVKNITLTYKKILRKALGIY